MTRHLADHRKPATVSRLTQFLRIERESSDRFWQGLRRRPADRADANRRAVEYLKIARGRQV